MATRSARGQGPRERRVPADARKAAGAAVDRANRAGKAELPARGEPGGLSGGGRGLWRPRGQGHRRPWALSPRSARGEPNPRDHFQECDQDDDSRARICRKGFTFLLDFNPVPFSCNSFFPFWQGKTSQQKITVQQTPPNAVKECSLPVHRHLRAARGTNRGARPHLPEDIASLRSTRPGGSRGCGARAGSVSSAPSEMRAGP